MDAVEYVLSAVLAVYSSVTLYKFAFLIIGTIFPAKKFKPSKTQYKYAILIPARNEENVIAGLIDSIKKQDYPPQKIGIFVVAHNCTDGTAEKARAAGAEVYEYNNAKQRRKGYALKYLLEQIKKDYPDGIAAFDGYFVFDADNLLCKDTVRQINNAFDNKNFDFFMCYQKSKNTDPNWVSSYRAMQNGYIQQVTATRPLTTLGLSIIANGTGVLFRANLLQNGWRWYDIVEDWQFSMDLISKGYRCACCEAAKFYDEAPSSIKIMARQQTRWSHGVFYTYLKSFIKMLFGVFCPADFKKKYKPKTEPKKSPLIWIQKRLSNLNNIVSYFPMWPLSFIYTFLYPFAVFIYALCTNSTPDFTSAIFFLVNYFFVSYISSAIYAFIACIREHKNITLSTMAKLPLYITTWPIIHIILEWVQFASLFWHVKWKPIPHIITKDIDQTESQ
jgi:cellulose synthase/poly-beta-1,6-N-acetylglucosamine synthase-like glycosyltransferase